MTPPNSWSSVEIDISTATAAISAAALERAARIRTAFDHSADFVPERFGRYVLTERLGQGGMAEVFRAVVPGDHGFRRAVVLKRILAEHSSSPALREMFVSEARICAMLHHPNIVQVFDFGQVGGRYFLAMELVDGWELGAVNRALGRTGRRMPIEVAIHVTHQVLLGLSYAHTLSPQGERLNIVHRDVSPSNIMCLRAGGVKLLDFGVASTAAVRESRGQGAASFCGKLSYSAPEYVRDQIQDARIDVFAMGVVLWESLAGERLFRGTTDEQTLDAVLTKAVPPPSELRPAISAEIDRIVLKALERDPARRYPSATAMAEDLERILSHSHYQSQALPRLLTSLFGEGRADAGQASAIEVLLESATTAPVRPLPPRPDGRPAWPRIEWSSRAPELLRSLSRAWPWVMAACVALLLAAKVHGSGSVVQSPARMHPRPTLQPVIESIEPASGATAQPALAARNVEVSGTGGSQVAARTAARLPRWSTTLQPARKSHPHKPRGLVIQGKHLADAPDAIDPFAEAAARGR